MVAEIGDAPVWDDSIEIQEGLDPRTNRVTLKTAFMRFGEITGCWVEESGRKILKNLSEIKKFLDENYFKKIVLN